MSFNNRGSLGYYSALFRTRPPPDLASLAGSHRASFVGPGWLRATSGPTIALGGLGGWWGKSFDLQGNGTNVVRRHGALVQTLPMRATPAASLVDGRQGITISYAPGSPVPWPWVVDEARRLDETTLLCLTIIKAPGLRRLWFPFILRRQELTDER